MQVRCGARGAGGGMGGGATSSILKATCNIWHATLLLPNVYGARRGGRGGGGTSVSIGQEKQVHPLRGVGDLPLSPRLATNTETSFTPPLTVKNFLVNFDLPIKVVNLRQPNSAR